MAECLRTPSQCFVSCKSAEARDPTANCRVWFVCMERVSGLGWWVKGLPSAGCCRWPAQVPNCSWPFETRADPTPLGPGSKAFQCVESSFTFLTHGARNKRTTSSVSRPKLGVSASLPPVPAVRRGQPSVARSLLAPCIQHAEVSGGPARDPVTARCHLQHAARVAQGAVGHGWCTGRAEARRTRSTCAGSTSAGASRPMTALMGLRSTRSTMPGCLWRAVWTCRARVPRASEPPELRGEGLVHLRPCTLSLLCPCQRERSAPADLPAAAPVALARRSAARRLRDPPRRPPAKPCVAGP